MRLQNLNDPVPTVEIFMSLLTMFIPEGAKLFEHILNYVQRIIVFFVVVLFF